MIISRRVWIVDPCSLAEAQFRTRAEARQYVARRRLLEQWRQEQERLSFQGNSKTDNGLAAPAPCQGNNTAVREVPIARPEERARNGT